MCAQSSEGGSFHSEIINFSCDLRRMVIVFVVYLALLAVLSCRNVSFINWDFWVQILLIIACHLQRDDTTLSKAWIFPSYLFLVSAMMLCVRKKISICHINLRHIIVNLLIYNTTTSDAHCISSDNLPSRKGTYVIEDFYFSANLSNSKNYVMGNSEQSQKLRYVLSKISIWRFTFYLMSRTKKEDWFGFW